MGRAIKSSPKKEYLLRKMVDGAEALYDFFETMKDDKRANPYRVAEEITSRYQLTQNQQKYLGEVVERVHKGRRAISFLEDKFGLNEDGTFKDTEGLYQSFFNKPAPARIVAKSHNIAIGFEYGIWKDKKNLGLHPRGNGHDSSGNWVLHQSTRETLYALRNWSSGYCLTLTFNVAPDNRFREVAKNLKKQKTSEKPQLGIRPTSASELKDSTTAHELRHVIDQYLGNGYFFVETPAHLYDGTRPLHGFARDINRNSDEIKEGQKMLGDHIVKRERDGASEKEINQLVEELGDLNEEMKNLFGDYGPRYGRYGKFFPQFVRGGLSGSNDPEIMKRDWGAMSYLFSTIPRKKLFRRLEEVAYPSCDSVEKLNEQEPEVVIMGGEDE